MKPKNKTIKAKGGVMKITSIDWLDPPNLEETDTTCKVCNFHDESHRVEVDGCWSMRICKHCLKLEPEHWLLLMREKKNSNRYLL